MYHDKTFRTVRATVGEIITSLGPHLVESLAFLVDHDICHSNSYNKKKKNFRELNYSNCIRKTLYMG